MKYYVKTFGCQQNKADSERIEQAYAARGYTKAKSYKDANSVIINTCMVRHQAENRVYGLVHNLAKIKTEKAKQNIPFKIIVTGCMVGLAFRDKSGKYMEKIRDIMPDVDEFLPIEEIGFDYQPVRADAKHAWVPISNGCNNFCTFCIVPFTRGREISRPFDDIVNECKKLKAEGYTAVTLLGQNVNSYGADLILGADKVPTVRDIEKTYFKNEEKAGTNVLADRLGNSKQLTPTMVKHLGRYRIPTLFPQLLAEIAKLGFEHIDFMSSNPWDFSDELIQVIADNKNITRLVHLPIQSGSNSMLKRMNRWYTTEEYVELIGKLRSKVPDIRFSTDIIVGFCGETDEEFDATFTLSEKVGFEKAYIAMYTPRPMTHATKAMEDDVPHRVKKQRWQKLDALINHQFVS